MALERGLAVALLFAAGCQVEQTPANRCARDARSADFQVCVVDEAGRPLAAVAVYAAYTRYGGSGPYTDSAGTTTTDATGLATFRRPASHEMWAIAERPGWPPQAELKPGTIVLGPPRTLRGAIRFAQPCANAEIGIGVHDDWQYSQSQPAPAYLHAVVNDDHSFVVENLGPGSYHVSVNACDQGWSGDVQGTGRTLDVPLALGSFGSL